ncbi:hypothetical protein NOS3756_27320 [Nostoc sp. NIES-3756]|uniref:hypothetical protein n=1 Tax=Nostoc sp. NIES-3756 TaxID=1751286 RepID=UPI00072086B1|nr:hypothetical protein [Nostoc sp. NIES-3756]BAT53769.1 hypothetical protein NOS3756_27320 [Nostoc sp. NIES-3756]
MPGNSTESNLPWTEEHESYCYQHHIPPAAKILWQWLMRQGEISEEIEPDLAAFNAWVKKVRGKEYSHNYLKKIFDILVESRVIQVVKQYSWKIFKLLVRPLDWLKPPKKRREKKLHNHNSSYKTEGSNDSSAVDPPSQQQHSNIDSNSATLDEIGIHFDSKTREVLERPQSEIKLAIMMFDIRGGFDKIRNPEGFIRDCLRERWWEYPRNYNLLLQKFGNSTEWEELFPSG